MAYSNITVIPVADNSPVINPNGHPNLTENQGPILIIDNIIDNDQLTEHQLIDQINISMYNATVDEVSSAGLGFFPAFNSLVESD